MLFFKKIYMILLCFIWVPMVLPAADVYFNVMDYGAISDGKTLCTTEIQKTIDACNEAGGGYVVFPSGEFLTGTIELKNNVFLQIHPAATLLGSKNIADYDPGYLIYAKGITHAGILGEGTINGQGDSFWKGKERPFNRPGRTIKFLDCRDIVFKDFHLINSASWCIDVEGCDRVTLTGLTIINDRDAPNTDGIDPVSSSNVFISDCYIDTGDDCICPKSNDINKPCENLVVTNCVLISDDSAIKCGTRSNGAIRNCTFSNIVIRNTKYGIGFYMKDGGSYEDIQFSNISIETIIPADLQSPNCTNSFAIFMDIEGRDEQTPLGTIRNIMFNDINILSYDGNCLFAGMPEQNINDLTLNNVRMNVLRRTDLAERSKPRGTRTLKNIAVNDRAGIQSYFTFVNIDGLSINNLFIDDESITNTVKSYCLWGQNIKNVTLEGFQNCQSVSNENLPLVLFENISNLFVSRCQPVSATTPFISLQGAQSSDITLLNNNFSSVGKPVSVGPNVDSKQVYMDNNRLQ